MNIIGEVKNKDCIIVDDIIDSGGTIVNAVEALKKSGANEVYVFITCLLYTSPSPRDGLLSRMPSSA